MHFVIKFCHTLSLCNNCNNCFLSHFLYCLIFLYCLTIFLYYFVKVSKKTGKPNLVVRMKLHATIGWHDLWSRDRKLRTLYHNFHEDHNHNTRLEYICEQNDTIPIDMWFIITRLFIFLYVIHVCHAIA